MVPGSVVVVGCVVGAEFEEMEVIVENGAVVAGTTTATPGVQLKRPEESLLCTTQ